MVKRRTTSLDERGQALILVLLLLLLGSLVLVPILAFMNTGMKVGRVFQNKTDELYAADAGIEDAVWQIQYDHLATRFTDPPYEVFDYATIWSYDFDSPDQVNGKATTVSIRNIWIPEDIEPPAEGEARDIIETGKLTVSGATPVTGAISQYKIKVQYYPGAEEDLEVRTVGIWLPPDFTYYSDATHKSTFESLSPPYNSVPVIQDWAGNQAILWSFSGGTLFRNFPNVTGSLPMTMEATFYFKPPAPSPGQPYQEPDAVAWITTDGVADIRYAWDANIRVYCILSVSGDTTVEGYISKAELRKTKSAIAGDYCAAGNSLMIDTNNDMYGIRDLLLTSSSATVTSIPSDAEVDGAFLYWSAWRAESSKQTLFSDSCNNFDKWVTGSSWTASSGTFRGRYTGGDESARYLTLRNGLDLSAYPPGTAVQVTWKQSESGRLESDDALVFSFSADGGGSWSGGIDAFRDDISGTMTTYTYIVPQQYLTNNFKMRYYLADFGDSNDGYCSIDDIKIAALVPDDSVVFKIDSKQVYFDKSGNPQQGAQELVSSKNQVLPNYLGDGSPNGFSYSCYRDVTALVRNYSASPTNPPINYPGNATYTLGGVVGDTADQWSYAGWSLIVVYGSAATQGHQLYLYDKFVYAGNDSNIDFDNDGDPGGTITGFIVPDPIEGEANAAKLTCFVGEGDQCWDNDYLKVNGTSLSNPTSPANNVWNSKSPGLGADGVDIDTFDITWGSHLLSPGDTSVRIDLPTHYDSWNLVYIILSFRSETRTGGAISYLIRG